MSDLAQPRRLATIVALDVAGYSARTEADEAATSAEVLALRGVIEEIAARYGGRVFNTAGDGFMLEFGSSLAAVQAAFELAETCQPKVRVGVHLGDVIVQPNGDLLGHGVNVAARLMSKSDPGSALVSAAVRQTIRGPIFDRLIPRGLLQLDKMAETIEAFSIKAPATGDAVAPQRIVDLRPRVPVKPWTANWMFVGAFIAAVVLLAILVTFAFRTGNGVADGKSIAILPFEDHSQNKVDSEYGEWLSELIGGLLGKAHDLRVISQTSASVFKGKAVALPEIARQLGVTMVAEGSVRREGNDIVIIANLFDAATEKQVWSETYQRKTDNALGTQSEIAAKVAAAVASALKVTISAGEQEALTPTTNTEAYEAYRDALKLYRTSTEVNVRGAQRLLSHAVELDPSFAAAWALLARVHSYLYFSRTDATDGRRAAAEQALTEARRLNPDLADVLLADAYYEYWVKRDYEGARIKFEKLNEKWPSNADALAALGSITRRQGRWDESKAYFESVVTIDPLHAGRRLKAAELNFAMRDMNGALRQIDDSLQHWPAPPDSLPFIAKKALIYQALGRLDDADKLLQGFDPQPDGDLVQPIVYQAILRRRYDGAIRLLEGLLKRDQAEGSVGRTSIDLNIYLGDLRRLAGDVAGANVNYGVALDKLRLELAQQPENADINSYLALVYGGLGNRAEAVKHADLAVKAVPLAKDALSGAYYLDVQARVWSRFGERDAAIPAIETLMKLPAPLPLTPALLRLDPDFDKLRSDARFKALATETH